MGILRNGPNGGFSGKAGSYIGYYFRGQWVIRGLPKLSTKNKIGTTNQKVCRSKFRQLQTVLQQMINFIRIGFNLEGRLNNNSAYNSATSWNMLHAFDENGDLNYSAFQFSKGNLAGPADVAVGIHDDQLIVSWRDNSDEGQSRTAWDLRENDQVILLGYFPSSGSTIGVYSGARRSACKETLKLGNKRGLHTWIAFISDDRQGISDSVYAGFIP